MVYVGLVVVAVVIIAAAAAGSCAKLGATSM